MTRFEQRADGTANGVRRAGSSAIPQRALSVLVGLEWLAVLAAAPILTFPTVRPLVLRAVAAPGVDLGLMPFWAGLAATSTRWWERTLWGVLSGSWLVQALVVVIRRG